MAVLWCCKHRASVDGITRSVHGKFNYITLNFEDLISLASSFTSYLERYIPTFKLFTFNSSYSDQHLCHHIPI